MKNLIFVSVRYLNAKSAKVIKAFRFTFASPGSETRQILSGIAKFHKPEELIGKNVLFVANLKPRKMMGLESCGMILSAEFEDKLTVLTTLMIFKAVLKSYN